MIKPVRSLLVGAALAGFAAGSAIAVSCPGSLRILPGSTSPKINRLATCAPKLPVNPNLK